jgi:hypothetical protein
MNVIRQAIGVDFATGVIVMCEMVNASQELKDDVLHRIEEKNASR